MRKTAKACSLIINNNPFKLPFDGLALFLSASISGMIVLGIYVIETIYNLSPLYSGMSGKISLLLGFLLLTVSMYLGCKCLFFKLESRFKSFRRISDRSNTSFLLVMSSGFKGVFVLFLVCWLPYLIVRFPGNLDPDTLWQVMQPSGLVIWSDHHPWFDTLVFYFFWMLGDLLGSHAVSLFLYGLLQAAFTAAVFSAAITYFEFVGIPNTVVRFSIGFFALYPAIPLFAFSMAKDMLFAVIWIPFILMYIEIMRTRGKVLSSKSFFVLWVIMILLLMLTKKTGIYLVLISSIPLILLKLENKTKIVSSIIACSFFFSFVWSGLLLPCWGVQKGGSAEMLSVPSQQVSLYLSYHSSELDENDWDVLESVYIDPHSLSSVYQPGRADATKARWKENSTVGERLDFLKWYINAMIDDPRCYFLAAAAVTLPLYFPDYSTQGDESLLFYRDNLASAEETDPALEQALIGYSDGKASAEDIAMLLSGAYRDHTVACISDAFNAFILTVMNAMPLLFSKAMFTTYIPLVVLTVIFRLRSIVSLRSLVCLVPFAVTLLTLIAGPIALPRYMVASVYSLPILVAIPFIFITNNSNENSVMVR